MSTRIEMAPGDMSITGLLAALRNPCIGSQVPLIQELSSRLAVEVPLVAHLHRQARFSQDTFGPGTRTAGICAHIRLELAEIEHATTPAEALAELIDVVILAFDGALRLADAEVVAAALVAKQAKNEARDWPDWRLFNANQPIEHLRTADDGLGEPTLHHPDLGGAI